MPPRFLYGAQGQAVGSAESQRRVDGDGERGHGGRADLIGGLIILSSRAEVIDYSIAIQQTWNMIVVRKPSSKDMTWTSYTKEFTPWAWAGVGVLTALAPCILLLGEKQPEGGPAGRSRGLLPAHDGMMTQQGSEMRVSSTSCRIIFFAMFVSAQLIVMHYSSFLISMLSVSNNILPFKNLEELHRTGDYQLGIWKGSFTEDTFRQGNV
nr:uncharacterized protein LOC113819375 [Penaeus vannamei]